MSDASDDRGFQDNDNVFWAVADPAVRLVLDYLRLKDASADEIAAHLSGGQTAARSRLRRLESVGLVSRLDAESGVAIFRLASS